VVLAEEGAAEDAVDLDGVRLDGVDDTPYGVAHAQSDGQQEEEGSVLSDDDEDDDFPLPLPEEEEEDSVVAKVEVGPSRAQEPQWSSFGNDAFDGCAPVKSLCVKPCRAHQASIALAHGHEEWTTFTQGALRTLVHADRGARTVGAGVRRRPIHRRTCSGAASATTPSTRRWMRRWTLYQNRTHCRRRGTWQTTPHRWMRRSRRRCSPNR
jgi:hypothetical protein